MKYIAWLVEDPRPTKIPEIVPSVMEGADAVAVARGYAVSISAHFGWLISGDGAEVVVAVACWETGETMMRRLVLGVVDKGAHQGVDEADGGEG